MFGGVVKQIQLCSLNLISDFVIKASFLGYWSRMLPDISHAVTNG